MSVSSCDPSIKFLCLLYKAFFRPILTYASPVWFPFLSVSNTTKVECLHRAASRTISSCLSSFPIALLLSEASLSSLRVTLAHFTQSSYERALRLPSSFSISGLARLGVKQRPFRSSWRAFASIHPLMLSSTSPREVLFACFPFLPWNPPSFTVESILSTLCSRSDLPLSHQEAALAHFDSLTPHDLRLRTDGQLSVPFQKADADVLANCSLRGTEATLSFRQAQFAQDFLLKPTPFYKLSASFGSTNNLPFLFPSSRFVFSSVFPFTSNFIADLAGTVFFLLLYYQATMGPRTPVSPVERLCW